MNELGTTLIPLSILAPIVAAFLLMFHRQLGQTGLKAIAALGFILPAAFAILLWCNFGAAERVFGYAFYSETDLGLSSIAGIQLILGLNGISLPLFVLAGIVGVAAGLHAIQSGAERLHLYLQLLLLMQAGLMGVFASIDIFFFYFFHEFALIPTFIMIGIWGSQGRRVAAMEMTIYLTLGAMLSLIGLISLYHFSAPVDGGQASFNIIELRERLRGMPLDAILQNNLFAILMIGFGILVSLFPFHSWAPRGYAAAPTANAMLHAGVLKKFGLYGLLQIAAPLLPQGVEGNTTWLVWLALGNVVILGLVTMAQRDLKQMIGYSSVMHMGYCFLGIATMSVIGVGGTVVLMFGHGLSVALMFLLATSVFNRTQTYDMREMGGLVKKTPVLAAFFVLATMAGIGLPGFANFWGEFTVFASLWGEFEWWVTALAVLGIIISAIYGLRAVANVFFGEPSKAFAKRLETEEISDLRVSEKVPAVLLVALLIFVGFWPRSISDGINNELVQEAHLRQPVISPLVTGEAAAPIHAVKEVSPADHGSNGH